MTYLIVSIYVLLILLLLVSIIFFIHLLGLLKKAEKTLSQLDDTILSLNSDLPVILENVKEASEEAKETSKMARIATKKAKDGLMWLDFAKNIVGMFLKFKKKEEQDE